MILNVGYVVWMDLVLTDKDYDFTNFLSLVNSNDPWIQFIRVEECNKSLPLLNVFIQDIKFFHFDVLQTFCCLYATAH